MQELFAMGIRQDEYDSEGENFIHVAAREDRVSVLEKYLPSCSPDVVNRLSNLTSDGDTPLMKAARQNNDKAVEALVSFDKVDIMALNAITDLVSMSITSAWIKN